MPALRAACTGPAPDLTTVCATLARLAGIFDDYQTRARTRGVPYGDGGGGAWARSAVADADDGARPRQLSCPTIIFSEAWPSPLP